MILASGTFTNIEAFPQKDDPWKRVFKDAKLSTAIVVIRKTSHPAIRAQSFTSRVHPEKRIEPHSPVLTLSAKDIRTFDPENLTIVSCSQTDWDLATRLINSGRFCRMKEVCTSFQGEVNETIEKARGVVADKPQGSLILRGSNVCLYILREASQGVDLYLQKEVFLRGKSPTAKALHSAQERIGFQRSSPQNNFRRLVACLIPPGKFCFDTVSYVPQSESRIPLHLLLALLNSKLLDWYFRLGSTNSKVNEYQFNALPCPLFANSCPDPSASEYKCMAKQIALGDLAGATLGLESAMQAPPFPPIVAAALIEAAKKLVKIESLRPDINRADRSSLGQSAVPYQQFIDTVLFRLAGFFENDAIGVEERLQNWL